ncbi:plasmid mobilization protein [Streptomyces sp. NPDC012746]|uniref:plasmid mobilization protein n=1 Tax=Streptomyces sp. NPDC012746 TaxID=3364845 RepID=UPI0036A4B9E9
MDQMPARRRARRSDAPRKKQINISVNDLEYATLYSAAVSGGLSVGAFVATAALAVAKEEVNPAPVDRKDKLRALADARVSVNRIGTNANQITAVYNSRGEAPPPQVIAVMERCAKAVETLDAATLAVMEGRI